MSPFDSQYAAPVASVKPKARGGVGACDRQGIENPGCRTRAGQRPDRRRPGLSSVVLAALPFLVFAPAAFSFGEAGHSGMSRWAFDLLQVTNSTGQPISRFPYHGDGFYENLGVASTIPDDLPEGSELLMQPADHYYDPDDPAWVFPFLEWNGHSYQIYGSLEWLGVVYTVIDESVEWQAGRYGIDGSGYNGLSGFLFYLLGGSPEDSGNPTKGTDRAGALQILREISDSPGAPSAETEKDFTDLLGSAFHYLQDIHSAGHTDPSSWYGIKGVTLCPFSVLVLEKGNWHIKFDMTGDAYFEPVDTLECLGNFAECWGEFRGHYNAFQDERRDPDKLPILVYRYKGPPCTYQPERDKPVPPDSDLAQLFHDAAVASKAKMWDPFGDLDDYEAPDATFSVFCSSLAESLDLAARRCAGVVDWVFTMAAEGQEEVDWVGTGQGQVARRDAPNFLGIARAMASGGQVVIVEGDLSIPGKLSGVDQDDFYPLKMASGAWEFRFPTEGEAGPTMALYNDRGDSLAEGSELQCDGPGEVYLRVF